ncbi:hypothetical protein J3R83DRAFT_3549 [Lanmaoa asiatica]|nr:hypothetical protein J3R83DRAFT_3549 [Lanmaoa asiatica]
MPKRLFSLHPCSTLSSSLSPPCDHLLPPPPIDDFPSSPSSSWSCRSPSSSTQDHLSPPTPESCFSPAPTIVSPDDFALQIDVQFDKAVALGTLSENGPMFSLRGRYEQATGSKAPRPSVLSMRLASLPVTQDSASDDFSWEAIRSSPVDPNELVDSSRYSILIHEVPDILPLSLTPTKSLASRKHKAGGLPHRVNANLQLHSSSGPISPSISPYADNANPSLHNEKPPPVSSRDLVTPIPRHKSADVVRPRPSPRRRQGQVFHFEPPLRNAVDLDETFFHPREPPPKPIPNPSANRCSSLDRLECSLRKLEAHAPGNHRKSQSEGRSLNHVAQRKDKRPSLPPPWRLTKQQSIHEIMYHNPSRLAHGCHLSGSSPPPIPLHQYPVPQTCPAVHLDDEHHEEDLTPGSFMDMDIPLMEEASQKRQASFRQVTSKEKIKSLVSVAKRVSRGVIAWGKNLTASTKPPVTGQETTTVQSAYLSL